MRSFIIFCYILLLFSGVCLTFTGIQGYVSMETFGIPHPHFGLLTIMLHLFTQTCVLFFFVGTGKQIREYVKDHPKASPFEKQAADIRKPLFSKMFLNILLLSIVFILGGAVHTTDLPSWVHGGLFCLTYVHFLILIRHEHLAFKKIVLEVFSKMFDQDSIPAE